MPANRITAAAAALLLTLSFSTKSNAQMQLPYLISDGMVIQRDARVPIWGWTEPDTEVQVMFRDHLYTGGSDANGKWQVELPPMHAGGPFEMRIVANDEMTTISDILIGDVWVCSGQSNMEWVVQDVNNAEQEMATANDNRLRHFKVPRSWSWEPEDKLAGGSWEATTPETVGQFTAVGYFFARDLRKDIDVPIGLLHTSWGGSRLEPWMSAAALGFDQADIDSVRSGVENFEAEIRANLSAKLGELPTEDRGYVDGKPVWAAPDLDDSSWDVMELPIAWEWAGYPGMDGIGWYRKTFSLTEAQAAAGARLGLGMIDDSDVTWVNGVEVGGMQMAWNKVRDYTVPPTALHAGENVIAIWVEDTGGGGGVMGDPSLLFVESNGERQSLAGPWKFNVGKIEINLEGFKNQVPTVLYNKMVYPVINFPITGVIWYQGESNAGPGDAYKYRTLFKDMITQWRDDWGEGDFPFLWVQLANYMDVQPEPVESDWAMLRESQSEALSLPNTAQAVIIDIGEANDIHPRNKQDVGYRLALAARKLEYGEEDVLYSGPVLKSHEVVDGKMYLDFDFVGDGLELRPLPNGVTGFALAGPDSVWTWAQATLEGNRVVVSSAGVANPVAVRYAWADNPAGANLYNSAGLPASPFRTDDW